MKEVIITVEGGVVQYVDVPAGVRVIIRDYDVEGTDSENITVDTDGKECIESTYEGDEKLPPLKDNGFYGDGYGGKE